MALVSEGSRKVGWVEERVGREGRSGHRKGGELMRENGKEMQMKKG